uniref:Uncharacterized protein n=1 Tax=Rhizophora mucronata TaxID=61149 RepID=A0A2P2N5F5_RHIMU
MLNSVEYCQNDGKKSKVEPNFCLTGQNNSLLIALTAFLLGRF